MRERLHGLDALRGLTLLSMIAYHTAWDLVYLFGVNWPWYHSVGAFVWQQSICWTFILLSGYCARLGTHTLRRGATVSLYGALITAVTLTLMPGNRVWFGVLSLLGASMILTALSQAYLSRIPDAFGLTALSQAYLSRIPDAFGLTALSQAYLSRIPDAFGLTASFALFLMCYRIPQGVFGFSFPPSGFAFQLPQGVSGFSFQLPARLYRNDFTACLGFPPHGFFSTDYFPLLPWFFLFRTGFHLSGLLRNPPRILAEARPAFLSAIGRRSLEIYLLHQPVIYALLSLIFRRVA